jgi:hypothetical protein
MTRRPWNKRIYPAQRQAEKERLAEISAETDHAAAELRWSTFVDTMTAVATELAPERPVERPEQAYTTEDSEQQFSAAQQPTEHDLTRDHHDHVQPVVESL